MVAGGFKNDLAALNDLTPHDERYARLVEYTTIIQSLLRTADPVSFEGRYYSDQPEADSAAAGRPGGGRARFRVLGTGHAGGAATGGYARRVSEAAG